MLKKRKIFSLLLFFLTVAISSHGQNEISSPYSVYGVGIINNVASGPLAAMGGLSYSLQSPYYINFRNPASYAAFDSLSFIADVAFSIVSGKLTTSQLTQQGSYARPGYISIGLPVTKHWHTSVGFLPFSDRGYTITDQKEIDDIGTVNYEYSGEGGLMQLYWGNAFKLCKGLSFGFNASYLFGTLTNARTIYYSGTNMFNSHITQSSYVDGIYLSAGLQYHVSFKENHSIGLGVVYENTAYIWAKQNMLINIFDDNTYTSTDTYDTVLMVLGKTESLTVPQTVGGGISYSYKNKVLVGVDVAWQNWAKYSYSEQKDSLKNSIVGTLGIQYTPDPTSSKYYKKIAFRAGVKYSTGYIQIRNTPITEYAVTFGLGFPFRTFSSRSSLNVMFEFGSLGTIKNNLIRQNYYKISFNFILQERWYQRRKLE